MAYNLHAELSWDGTEVPLKRLSTPSLLVSAVENGDELLVQKLLTQGDSVACHSEQLDDKTNALGAAARHKRVDILKSLLDEAEKVRLPLKHYLIALAQCQCSMVCSEPVHVMLRSAIEDVRRSAPQTHLSHLYVKTLAGKWLNIAIRLTDTCLQLKNRIHDSEGIPIDDQYLLFNSRWVPEQDTLLDRGLYDGCKVYMLLPIWEFRRTHR